MIDQKIIITNTTSAKVYEALIDSELHSKLTGDKAIIDPVVGGLFSTFSGYADGQTLKLIPGKMIEQTWRASDWPDNHYSKIIFELNDVSGGVEIHFTQTNLPEGSQEEFESGWQDNYWSPLKEYFS